MRVQVLQHFAAEDIGAMAPWFKARGARLGYTRFFEPGARLPAVGELDLIVVMGGPMSVNDEAELPWLVEEKRFLREAIAAGVAVLGICLGGQLIASALGAAVRANPEPEVGWFPITAQAGGRSDVFAFPARINVLHWHGETFDLPPGAVLLASSEACAHQAFQIGRRVIGLQCHPEMTPEIVAALLEDSGQTLAAGPWVQPAPVLASVEATTYAPGHALIACLLDYLTAA